MSKTQQGFSLRELKKIFSIVFTTYMILAVAFYFLAGEQLRFRNSRGNIEMPVANHMISAVFNLYNKEVYPYVIAWDERNEDVHNNTIDRALESKDLKVIATVPFLVGYKENLNSSIWGFNNSQYNDMIEASGKNSKN